MTNGNHFNEQPGGDWSTSPADPALPAQYNATDTHPLANNSFDFTAFLDIVKLVFNRAKDGPLLKAFIAITTIGLAWGLLTGVVQSVAYFISGDLANVLGLVMAIMGLLLIPLYIIVNIIQFVLYRPLARQVFDGPTPLGSLMDVIKSTTPHLLMAFVSLLILGVAIGIGTLLCVLPGIAAGFFLSQGPYLVVVRDQSIGDAFKNSFERAKTHWHVLVMAVAMVFVGLIATSIILLPLNIAVTFAGGFFGPIAYLGTPLVSWAYSIIIGVLGFIVATAAFTTIDELEGLETIHR